MLTQSKKDKLLLAVKNYNKKFLNGKYTGLDESGTRLMINSFLTDVLGYTAIEEVKTEYMIRGTYADYVIQTAGIRHFLVEVKSLSLSLSEKHLRQVVNYGANEGIEWALLTNGQSFELYKILFQKPIESRLIFSVDLSDSHGLRDVIGLVQFLHKDSVLKKGLEYLWNKTLALDTKNIAGFLYAKPVTNFIRRNLSRKYKSKFTEDEITNAIKRVISEAIQLDDVKPLKLSAAKKKVKEPEAAGVIKPESIPVTENNPID